MRSAIKTVPAANSDHVTARAVGPSPEATMMKECTGEEKNKILSWAETKRRQYLPLK